jgi:hypothetical protein
MSCHPSASMSVSPQVLGLAILVAILPSLSAKTPERDAQSIAILNRVISTVGGGQALAAIHDITEKGEITFHSDNGIKGPVTIQMLNGCCFRLDAELPDGKTSWLVKEGLGSEQENNENMSMSHLRAASLENLSYPVGYAIFAIQDRTVSVSFVGVENREGRSTYRIRVGAQLGSDARMTLRRPLARDLLIDALTFDVVGTEDLEYLSCQRFGTRGSVHHEVDFEDFRVIHGTRLPFRIAAKVGGQETLDIRLGEVTFNSNLQLSVFQW